MHIARPRFQPWRILSALIFAYLASGFLYELAWQVEAIFHGGGDAVAAMLIVPGAFIDAWMALGTLMNLGFPVIDGETFERANLYPIIIPIALAFLAFATRAVRFGSKPTAGLSETDAGAGAAGTHSGIQGTDD